MVVIGLEVNGVQGRCLGEGLLGALLGRLGKGR